MADSKYGRLFTEADMRRALRYAAHRGEEAGVEALCRDAVGNLVEVGARLLAEMDAEAAVAPELATRFRPSSWSVFTFPPDEPLFLLRAKDEVALAGVHGYGEGCDMDGRVDEEQREAVREAIRRFEAWQREHPDRMKVPD